MTKNTENSNVAMKQLADESRTKVDELKTLVKQAAESGMCIKISQSYNYTPEYTAPDLNTLHLISVECSITSVSAKGIVPFQVVRSYY
jgi:hypothetical protein